MSSLPVASQIEVLDLRHFSARQLRPLLEREAELWRERLRWDYRSSTELLLQYLESRILHGFVALDRGRVCGYTFCVYEGHKAVIGDAFATDTGRMSDAEATRVLLVPCAGDAAQHARGRPRGVAAAAVRRGRVCATSSPARSSPSTRACFWSATCRRAEGLLAEEPGLQAFRRSWRCRCGRAQDYQAAGELIYASYVGHSDAQINDQYRTLHGSLRFLHNIVRFPGCGIFEANFSWMLRERQERRAGGHGAVFAGGAGVAHITQLCVAQTYRGRGLGYGLLLRTAQSLLRAGFEAITLTVTEDNDPAVKLYERFGFTLRHRFDAMVLEPRFKPC